MSKSESIKSLYTDYVVPSYARFDLCLVEGKGSWVWDAEGKKYLDFCSGIAVTCLGHAHPEIEEALREQAQKLIHVSNLYYTEPQGLLARNIVTLIGPGKCFFANSGAEANEGLYKLARKFGQESGRFEVVTAINSFHGRTLGGIAATGQEKIKAGFSPIIPGFVHVPFNDLDAVKENITPKTAAVLIEGIQGEGGVTAASPDYLLGLRRLCSEQKLLLLMDEVQCGHFRTGAYQSYTRILEDHDTGNDFLPDAISMAKGLGGGFPIGAFWISEKYASLLSAGSHGSTFGGTPLACAVANRIMTVINRDKLQDNARQMGEYLFTELSILRDRYPTIVKGVRGLGLLLGLEINDHFPALLGPGPTASGNLVTHLMHRGLLTVGAGPSVIRLLPALNISKEDAGHALTILDDALKELSAAGAATN